MDAPRNTKINNIQALRAFAAIAVVSFHTGYFPPTGHAVGSFGVDVFFVISGFIMARICDTNPSFFLRRRVIRIVPPYWLLTLLLFAFSYKFPRLLSATHPNLVELLKSLFFIPFVKDDGLIRPLLFVGWSLNYEMFFYLAVTAGLLLLPRRPLLLATGLILSIAAGCATLGHGGALTRFFGDGLMTEFPLGALAYTLAKHVPERAAERMRWVSAPVVAACVLYLVCAQGFALPWPGPVWTRTSLTSFVLILSAALLSKGGWDTRLKWLVLFGDSSYILYLVHPYCVYFLGRVVAPHLPILTITHLFGSIVATLLSIAVAVVLHLRAEMPTVNFLNKRFGGRRPITEFKPTT